ncbi:taurine catabolism dioxygenase [Lichtheimia corymbifera JMRC:FSU:9682]|uniref:Taurine catabolism dioxygenase n=1 Tax=Lichtheimia corymbifera JMRC:FSU:9682 TaxID=1263082 RepID=A0A068RGP4_9FUNG|nr:taurine catabolism dioxygenase [Lichtheimia corymbifera JMRC:FSU:9682]
MSRDPRKNRKKKSWRHGDLNPGPFACKANVIPLHHIPTLLLITDTACGGFSGLAYHIWLFYHVRDAWRPRPSAYDRLSPAWQKFVEGLEAVHSGDVHRETARITGYPLRREAPDNVHPVVRTHPVTGWKSLYVQRGFTRRIVGFTKRESDAVLEFLFNHIESGHDFQVRFRWQEDSIAVWDNRATYHTAINDYFGNGIRHGFRITPTAERPYFDPNSKSRQQVLDEKASVTKKD